MSALYYSVKVTAKNLLTDGYSERQVCSNTTISKYSGNDVCKSTCWDYHIRLYEYFLHTLVDTRVNVSVMLCTFQVQEMTFCQWL